MSTSASPPSFSRAARASSQATAASATTASASTAATSLRSTRACAGSPVARSTESSGRISVGSGFIAARTTSSSPFEMPASIPPARFERRVRPGLDLVVGRRAALASEREAVADLDPLHRLDPHQRRREPRVEPVLAGRVRAEPGEDARGAHLDDAAERVAVGAGGVDRLPPSSRARRRSRAPSLRPRSRARAAAPSRRRRRRRTRPCGGRSPARARRARPRGRTSGHPRGRRGPAAAASPASFPFRTARPPAATGSSPTSSSCGRGCGRRARAAFRACARAGGRRAPRPRPARAAGAGCGRSPAGAGAGRRRSQRGRA